MVSIDMPAAASRDRLEAEHARALAGIRAETMQGAVDAFNGMGVALKRAEASLAALEALVDNMRFVVNGTRDLRDAAQARILELAGPPSGPAN